jgi:hypothetical protein
MDYNPKDSEFYSDLVASLQERLDEVSSELKKTKTENQIEAVKAKMMEPYANKVFIFCCAYCFVVASIIISCGTPNGNLKLSDTVLSVIAGSTAVSVIGLVGIVVAGLFGGKKH